MSPNKQQRIKSIWNFGKKYIPMFAVAEICILVSYTISVLLPINLTRLTDEVLYEHAFIAYICLKFILFNFLI